MCLIPIATLFNSQGGKEFAIGGAPQKGNDGRNSTRRQQNPLAPDPSMEKQKTR
jgi:hypothetical protein